MVNRVNLPLHPQEPSKKDLKLSFPSILYGLFFDPSIFLILQHKKVLKTLFLIVFLGMVSGSVIFSRTNFSKNYHAEQWKKWLTQEVQEFGLSSEGKFYWKFPKQLPHDVRIGDWVIRFRNQPFDGEKELPPGSAKGILWVSEESIVLSELIQTGGLRPKSESQMVSYDIGKFLAYALKHGEDQVITISEISLLVDRIVVNFKVVSLILKISSVVFIILLFPFFSSLISTFSLYISLKTGFKSSFPKILVANLYSVIPPMVIATIYSLINFPDLTYFTVFFVAYFFYHVFILKEFRKVILQQQGL